MGTSTPGRLSRSPDAGKPTALTVEGNYSYAAWFGHQREIGQDGGFGEVCHRLGL